MRDDRSSEDRAKDLAIGLAGALNVAGLLAAPRALSRALRKHQGQPTREALSKVLEDAVRAFGSSADTTELVQALCELLGHLATWKPKSPAPKPIVQAARRVLHALDVPEPDEGWDRWAGPSDEPEARPPPPEPRVLRAEPMTIAEWLAYEGPGELLDGLLVEEKIYTPQEDAIAAWFLATLRDWAVPRGGVVHGRGHKLVLSPTTGRKPDVCVHLPKDSSTKEAAPSIPTLIFEVITADRADQRRVRFLGASKYVDLGVRWFLILDSPLRLFEIFELASGDRYTRAMASAYYTPALQADDPYVSASPIEGLPLDLAALWTAVASPTAPPPSKTSPRSST